MGGSAAAAAVPAAKAPLQRTTRRLRSFRTAAVTDSTVPEGHKALHSTLYDKDAADVHGESRSYRPVEGEDDGSTVLSVDSYLQVGLLRACVPACVAEALRSLATATAPQLSDQCRHRSHMPCRTSATPTTPGT